MKPIRMTLWLLLLHHLPGVCAPEDAEHHSDNRIRQHLLGTTSSVVTNARERMIAALKHEETYNTDPLAWAAHEAIGRAPAAQQPQLRATLGAIHETFSQETENIQQQAIENTKHAKRLR